MKILVLVDKEPHLLLNPYIYTLMDNINQQFCDVEWGYGLNVFWSDQCFNYDIIHIHWPQILAWYNHRKLNIEDIAKRLKEVKEKGIKIISTCHNFAPHYNSSKLYNALYNLVYNESECILHLGKYSLNIFKEKYPATLNILLHHHIYDTVYKNKPTFEESIKALSLSPNMKYLLCFGEFRANEERRMIIELSQYLKGRNLKILAPSFCIIPKRRNLCIVFKMIVKFLWYKYKYHGDIIFERKPIDDNKLLYYYGASDISLIPRLNILNSGNVPLGFLMKNVVVGPNVGNIKEILEETGNPTFNPNDMHSLFLAIKEAQKMSEEQKGLKNYQYAIEHWSTNIIAQKLYQSYKQTLNYKVVKI